MDVTHSMVKTAESTGKKQEVLCSFSYRLLMLIHSKTRATELL